jgi:outer membrane usher protein
VPSALTVLLIALQLESIGAQPPVDPARVTVGICELFVNGRSFGDVLVGFDEVDGLLISARALADAGVLWTGAAERVLRGERVVAIASLAPAVTSRVDFEEAVAHVTVRADALTGTTRIGPQVERSIPLSRANNVFLNYAAIATSAQRPSYVTEQGGTIGSGLFRNTLSRNGLGVLSRGTTSATFDSPSRLIRFEAGDSMLAGDGFGGGTPVAGITVSREFAIDPLVLQYAPVSISGVTTLPGTAEVYVNGQLVSRTDVESGAFELRSLPVPTGRGTVRVVLRDAFGRAQELSSAYYRSPRVLRRGLHQFRYTFGTPRLDGTRMFHYGGVAGAAQHRVGLTNALTLGGSASFDSAATQAGPDVAWRLPVGEFEVAARASRGVQPTVGRAAAASYMLRGRWLTLTGSARRYSRTFEAPAQLPFLRQPRAEALGAAAVAWSGLSVEGQYSRVSNWNAEASSRWQLSAARQVARKWTMSLTALRTVTTPSNRPGSQVFVSLIRPLGSRTSSGASWRASSG